jgi:hypothetical protein
VALLAVSLTVTLPGRRRRPSEDPAEPAHLPTAATTDLGSYVGATTLMSNRLALTPGRAELLRRQAHPQPTAPLAPTAASDARPHQPSRTTGSRQSSDTPTEPAYTSWPALNAAIAQIPNYQPDTARWIVQDKGAWGATDLDHGIIYIAPRAPLSKLFSIVVHEYSHALVGRIYGGMAAAQTAADFSFGQQGEYGLEIEADCMAIQQGATWTDYTSCADRRWQTIAAGILRGQLPAGGRLVGPSVSRRRHAQLG